MPTATDSDLRISTRPRVGLTWRSALSALSERWIPMGISRCHAVTPWGAGAGRICRTPCSLELQFSESAGPQVRFLEADRGRVRLEVRPFQHALHAAVLGTLGAQVHDGRVVLRFRGNDTVDIVLTL